MNTASTNLTHHLEILRGKLDHPTDYEHALFYFLSEFAGDLGFLEQGDEDHAAHLRVVVAHVASHAIGRPMALKDFIAKYLPEFGFFHGRAFVGRQSLLFFYFERANLGLAALVLDPSRQNQVARFRLPDQFARNPRHN